MMINDEKLYNTILYTDIDGVSYIYSSIKRYNPNVYVYIDGNFIMDNFGVLYSNISIDDMNFPIDVRNKIKFEINKCVKYAHRRR